ncbi:MAG: hypothetical protein V1720_18600 [bacterium]
MNKQKNDMILLPGGNSQYEFLLKHIDPSGKTILLMGSSSEKIAMLFKSSGTAKIEIIVEDYDSMMNSIFELRDSKDISVKMMDFELTDYHDNYFDIIFAQGAISNDKRKNIVKELRRIRKPDCIICLGEIVKLKKEVPVFIKDVFESSSLQPLFIDELTDYYSQRRFDVLAVENLSYTLKDYYSSILHHFKSVEKTLTTNEKSYYKKLLNRISHESQVYLKQGGDKYFGFVVLLLKSQS